MLCRPGVPGEADVLRPPLRVAVVLDDMWTHAWIAETLRRVVTSPHASIVAQVVPQDDPLTAARAQRAQLESTTPIGRWVVGLLRGGEELAYPVPADAQALVDVSQLLRPARSHSVVSPGPVSRRVPYEEIAAFLQRLELDVVLWLSRLPSPPDCGSTATYGLWKYEFGAARVPFQPQVGFWEVLDRCPVTASYLVASGTAASPVVLRQALTATDRQSTARNSSNVLWKSAAFMAREIEQRRLDLRPDPIGATGANGDAASPSGEVGTCHVPSSRRLGIKVARHGLTRAVEATRNRMGTHDWILRVATKREHTMSPWRADSWTHISAGMGRFWADPMVVRAGSVYYVFVEEYSYAKRKAHIAVVTLDERGRFVDAAPVLEESYQLSYPFVFEYHGCWYMVPESSANRSIDVYQCLEFPHTWVHARTLVKGIDAADATLVCYGEKWWLFTAVRDVAGSAEYDELLLFSADSPLSTTWTPHPQNPLVSDARRARPAGRFFTLGDRLYRPSQDCSVRYGYGVRVNKVMTLTSDDYEEAEVDFVEPEGDAHLLATHTLSFADDLVVMDALRWHRRTRLLS